MTKKTALILLIILISLGIISYHFVEFLNSVSKKPSEDWSRDLNIGEKSFNLPSPLLTDGKDVYSVWTNNTGFTIYRITDYGENSKKNIKIDNFDEAKVNGIEIYRSTIFWLQNGNLFSINTDGSGYFNWNLNAQSFKIYNDNIIVSSGKGIDVFKIKGGSLEKMASLSTLKDVSKVDAVEADGRLYISALTEDTQYYRIYFTLYNEEDKVWGPVIQLYQLAQTNTSELSDAKITYDGGIYVFYNIKARDRSDVYYLYFNPDNIKNLSPVKVDLKVYRGTTSPNVGPFDVVQIDNKRVGAAFSADSSYRNFGQSSIEATEIIYAVFKNGEIKKVEFATNTGTWASEPALLYTSKGIFLTWVEAGGFYKYIVKAAGTNKNFVNSLMTIRKVDVEKALSTSIITIAAAFLLGLIFVFIGALPSYAWLIIIMLFEPPKLKNESSISFYIATLLYAVTKYFFYPPRTIRHNILGTPFPYNLLIIPYITLVLSFLIVKVFYGSKKFDSNFGAFTFMLIVDAVFTNLFYAPYIIM